MIPRFEKFLPFSIKKNFKNDLMSSSIVKFSKPNSDIAISLKLFYCTVFSLFRDSTTKYDENVPF